MACPEPLGLSEKKGCERSVKQGIRKGGKPEEDREGGNALVDEEGVLDTPRGEGSDVGGPVADLLPSPELRVRRTRRGGMVGQSMSPSGDGFDRPLSEIRKGGFRGSDVP